MPLLSVIIKRISIPSTYLLLLIIALFSTNCATIFKGSSAEITITSTPEEATVLVNNIEVGTTPGTFFLARNKDHVITFQKEGFEDVNIEINRTFDFETSVIGNLLSWSVLGFCVDYVTGAIYTLTPAEIRANFYEMAKAGLINPDELNQKEGEINVIMITTEQWEAIQAAK